ncbi:MAG: radical SAM protein [Syntrophorhabdus sp.]
MTRNCGWNRCLFCPVYKQGVKFSRRTIDDVKKDVDRAKAIDTLLMDYGLFEAGARSDAYTGAARLIEEIGKTQGEPTTGKDDKQSTGWFSSWFKDEPTIEDSVYHILTWRLGGGQTCFLGDSNSLVLAPQFFQEATSYIQQVFPELNRFTIYGRTKSAADMPAGHLEAFKQAGLDRIHFGLESGCNDVLDFMKKGVTANEHIRGCEKTSEAGISCGVYVMPGLGGSHLSTRHAHDTAQVITACSPDYVRLRTLEIFPGTRLEIAKNEGRFVEATEEEVVREIRVLVEGIDTRTEIVSDSASNLLDVSGKLPEDRQAMLGVVDDYLGLSHRAKLEFSLVSRLQSFIGQYGGLTQEIFRVVMPFIRDDRIDTGNATDSEIAAAIKLIRARLMP